MVFLSLFSLLLSVVIIGQRNHLSHCPNLLDRLCHTGDTVEGHLRVLPVDQLHEVKIEI